MGLSQIGLRSIRGRQLMSLPRRGFYTTDEQKVSVKGVRPFIHVFAGTWANRCCWRLLTCRQVAMDWGDSGAAWLAFRATGKTVLTAGF